MGYRSSWHDKLSGSIFVCDVTDGGDSSPKFRVQRYPCSIQSYVASSTVLSRPQLSSSSEYDKVEKDDSTVFGVLDDDSIFVQIMLGDCSPPTLDNDNDTYTGQREDGDFAVEKLNSSLPVSVETKHLMSLAKGIALENFLWKGVHCPLYGKWSPRLFYLLAMRHINKKVQFSSVVVTIYVS